MLYSYTYSVPYLLLLSLFILLTVVEYNYDNNRKIRQCVRICCCALFVLFFGFRGFVGWDWVNYYPAYQEIVPLFSRGYLNNYDIGTFEGGFVTFMSVVKLISSNYHFFILVCVVIDVSILHVFFKRHSSNYAFSFLIFIALYLGAELDILRNMKSIGLFLLSVKYIQQRRFLPYLLLMTLAFMFHSSTLFLFPLYFVPRTLPRQCFIVVFVVGNLLYLSQIAYMAPLISEGGRFLGGKYAALTGAYLNSDLYAQARGISIGYLERTLTFVLVVLFYKKLNNREQAGLVDMFLGFLCLKLWVCGKKSLVGRVGLLFLLSYLVLWPAVARCFTLKSNRMLFVGGIMIYSLIRVSICSNNILYRYDNVLLTGSNYPERMYIMDRYKDQLLNSN